jgi:hypothetical protein
VSLIDNRTALDSLKSAKCPACGGKKKVRQSLCSSDYFKLPMLLRKNLYARIGSGYSEALAEALAFLEVTDPKF